MILEKDQITAQADQAQAELEGKLLETTQQIGLVQAELASIKREREARRSPLQHQRDQVASLQSQHDHAVQHAKIVRGSAREEDALKALSDIGKQLTHEKKALQKLEHETSQAEKQSQAREQELTSTLQDLQTDQERQEQELSSLKQAIAYEKQTEGHEKFDECRLAIEEKQRLVDELESGLLSAKLEVLQAHEAAQETLSNWPDLRREIALLKTPDDATIRMLKANIQYFELLEKDAEHVTSPCLPSLQSVQGIKDLRDKLVLGDKISEIHQIAQYVVPGLHDLNENRLRCAKGGLRSSRLGLQRLLDEYISYVRNQE